MPKSVLVADDSLTIRKVIGMIFTTEDFTVTAVDNGLDAINRARELRPDVVLADCMMPGKSGYEVCEALKADPSTAHIPVMLLAGSFEPFDENRARMARADAHILKPFDSGSFLDKVKGLVGLPQGSAMPTAYQPVSTGAPPAAARPAPPPGQPMGAVPQPMGQPRPMPGQAGMPTSPGMPGPYLRPPGPGGPQGPRPGGPGLPPAPGMPGYRPGPGPGTSPGFPRPPGPGIPQGTQPGLRPGGPGLPPAPGMPAYRPPPGVPQGTQPGLRGGVPPTPGGGLPRPPPGAPLPGVGLPPRRDPFGLGAPQAPPPQHETLTLDELPAARAPDGGEAQLRDALSRASREVIEKIAWEVVPQLAETIIREQLDRLIKDRETRGLA